MKERNVSVYRITALGIMSAIIYVVTMFRFPFLGSKVHLANSMCLISGMLFGPLWGGIAAGFGSALYDGLAGGYDLMVILEGKTIREVSGFVSEKLSGLETVTGTATHFILKKYKDHGTVLGKKKEDTREIVTP